MITESESERFSVLKPLQTHQKPILPGIIIVLIIIKWVNINPVALSYPSTAQRRSWFVCCRCWSRSPTRIRASLSLQENFKKINKTAFQSESIHQPHRVACYDGEVYQIKLNLKLDLLIGHFVWSILKRIFYWEPFSVRSAQQFMNFAKRLPLVSRSTGKPLTNKPLTGDCNQ